MRRSDKHVAAVKQAGIELKFFEFLRVDCPNNNVHNIRVCRSLVASGAVSTADLSAYEAASKVR